MLHYFCFISRIRNKIGHYPLAGKIIVRTSLGHPVGLELLAADGEVLVQSGSPGTKAHVPQGIKIKKKIVRDFLTLDS